MSFYTSKSIIDIVSGDIMSEKKIVKREVKREKKKKSKKQRLFGFFMFLLIVGGIACFLLFFPSCGILDTMTKGFSTRYEFPSHYEATSKFEKSGYLDMVNINWRDGDVKVYTHDSDEILFEETPNETITEKFMMHCNYQETDKYGHSILVQYCKSGKWNFGNLKKDLIVYIPKREDLQITIHTYNSDIDFDFTNTTLSEMQIQSNYGNVDGIFNDANKVRLLGSSAKTVKDGYHYNIKSMGSISDLRYSTCQKMNLNLNKVDYFEGGGVWGEIYLDIKEARKANIKLSSATLNFNIGVIKEINFTDKYTNGGTLNLYFDPDASYKIDITRKELKVEGEVVDKTTTNSIGEKISDSVYKIGDGTNSINITISGDLNILAK